jgi:hypothetical protein
MPGVVGSATALLFFRGESKKRAIGTCVAGAILANIVGPMAADIMHSSLTVAGYVTGLFGMAVVAKIFEMIDGVNAAKARGDLWRAVLKRVKG